MADPSTGQINDIPEGWNWVPGDGPIEIEVPNGERLPLPPSTQLQGRYRNWTSTLNSGQADNLRGRSIVEVQEEANRVKLGGQFASFDEFDRCVDSWCVMNGCNSHHLATKRNYCL